MEGRAITLYFSPQPIEDPSIFFFYYVTNSKMFLVTKLNSTTGAPKYTVGLSAYDNNTEALMAVSDKEFTIGTTQLETIVIAYGAEPDPKRYSIFIMPSGSDDLNAKKYDHVREESINYGVKILALYILTEKIAFGLYYMDQSNLIAGCNYVS
jgi:hypothetical protein